MAKFVHIINEQVAGRYDLLPENWERLNLRGMTSEQRKEHGWYDVIVEEPIDWNGDTHKIIGPEFTIRQDDVLEKYTLVALTEEEIALKLAAKQQAEEQISMSTSITVTEEQLQSNPEIAELVARLKTLTN